MIKPKKNFFASFTWPVLETIDVGRQLNNQSEDAVLDDGEIYVTLTGSPFINAPTKSGLQLVDEAALLRMYRKEGENCILKLGGSWAFVIADRVTNRILIATDKMSRQSVFYKVTADRISITSCLESFSDAGESGPIERQSLYNYLHFHMIPSPATLYQNIHSLSAGNILTISRDGLELKRYWNPGFSESSDTSPALLQTRLRSALKRAVESSAQCDNKVGAFLSGGLDSSTVAGLLSESLGGTCDAYSIGFDAEGYDEMGYARITARHFGMRLHEYYVTPADVVSALPQIAATGGQPFGNSSILPAYFCARMASSDGVGTLLAGDGGDELFAGNERYARQAVFNVWKILPGWFRSTIVEPAVRSLPNSLPLASKAKSFVYQANTPLPDRLQHYSFLQLNQPNEVFENSLLQKISQDQPLQLLRSIFNTPDSASDLNRMLFMDWQITLADNDLRKVNNACQLNGVDVRYPMLDDELIEFSTTIPSKLKLHRGQLRYFYKQALKGWLPEATINKSKQGFGLPFGVWMQTHKPLQDLAYENIQMLKKRRIFIDAFLDSAIAQHRSGHASYYGELIWVLTTLELWLAANQPDYCNA